MQTLMKITAGPLAGWRLIIDNGAVTSWDGRTPERWTPAPLRRLAREYPVGSEVWQWLRQHGVRRPSPSGPSGPSLPRSQRGTRKVEISLSPAADAALSELARGGTKSAVVEALVMREAKRRSQEE